MWKNFGSLEWMLVVELLLLMCALIMWGAAFSVRQMRPELPLYRLFSVFWLNMLDTNLKLDPVPSLRKKKPKDEDEVGEEETSGPHVEGDDNAINEMDKLLHNDKSAAKKKSVAAKETEGQPATEVATFTLNVRVIPGAAKDEVVGKYSDGIKVRVNAPAEGGQANKAVLTLLAQVFGLKPYQISLVTGHFNQNKVVKISGLSAAQVKEKMSKFTSEGA